MIALLLAFPVLINSVKIFGNLILFIFVIFGVYISIPEKKNRRIQPISATLPFKK
ncbi:hypothetical protein BAZOLSSOX_218 [uncultured Gammaproteobacteria bacterium]|nr:hypothetical protein BAZOLSSOX_218 [uncultured Gammaproteobacteria bacterium]